MGRLASRTLGAAVLLIAVLTLMFGVGSAGATSAHHCHSVGHCH